MEPLVQVANDVVAPMNSLEKADMLCPLAGWDENDQVNEWMREFDDFFLFC
jgi:hypothetical protein